MPANADSNDTLQRRILACLHEKPDNRLTAAVPAQPAVLADELRILAASGMIRCPAMGAAFIASGGDNSFRMSIVLTEQGRAVYIASIKKDPRR